METRSKSSKSTNPCKLPLSGFPEPKFVRIDIFILHKMTEIGREEYVRVMMTAHHRIIKIQYYLHENMHRVQAFYKLFYSGFIQACQALLAKKRRARFWSIKCTTISDATAYGAFHDQQSGLSTECRKRGWAVGPSKAIWGILPRSHYMSMSQNSNVFNFYDACWTVDIHSSAQGLSQNHPFIYLLQLLATI